MTKEQAEFLMDAINGFGFHANLYKDYHGRGMREPTTGITTELNQSNIIAAVVNHMKGLDEDGLVETPSFDGLSVDNMGRDSIILY